MIWVVGACCFLFAFLLMAAGSMAMHAVPVLVLAGVVCLVIGMMNDRPG